MYFLPSYIQSTSLWLNERSLFFYPPSEQFTRYPEEHSVRIASLRTGSCILAVGLRIIFGESIVSWFFCSTLFLDFVVHVTDEKNLAIIVN